MQYTHKCPKYAYMVESKLIIYMYFLEKLVLMFVSNSLVGETALKEFLDKWARSCKNVSYAICKQQRCRSACASAQSDQHLCCSLLDIIMPLVSISEISRL